MDKKIKTLVVVGGGNSGWTIASTLVDRISPHTMTEIVLIESESIPAIGVGESTTGQIRRFINMVHHLGNGDGSPNEAEFLKQTGATFKYGIVHSDWRKVGESFVSPIGGDFENETRFPHEFYDYVRIHHVANKLPYDTVYQSQCMLNDKVFYADIPAKNPYPWIFGEQGGPRLISTQDVGYHLDSNKTGDYLRAKTIKTGRVKHIKGTVEKVNRDKDGYVTSVTLDSGSSIKGDLFFDCSGFSRLLMDDISNKFISYKDELLLNSTIVFPEEYQEGETIKTYTHAKAMKNGWMFEIPLQHRIGRGYNFCSNYTSAEEAKREVEELFGREVDVKKELKYETGRLEKAWDKNVISIGLAFGFLEPLEATAMHGVLKQVEHFMENYYSNLIDVRNEYLRYQYNRDMSYFHDDLKDFIVFHYQNTRQDTKFWRDASDPDKRSDRLRGIMEMWQTRMPRLYDYSDGTMQNYLALGNSLWYQIGLGMEIFNPELAAAELRYYGLEKHAKTTIKAAKDFSDYILPRSMSTTDFYKMLRNGQISL